MHYIDMETRQSREVMKHSSSFEVLLSFREVPTSVLRNHAGPLAEIEPTPFLMQSQRPARPIRAEASPGMALYEYIGASGMGITGGVTGSRYHFDRPGAKLRVDRRDAASLNALPNLRRIG
jgi:hypothetical protein